MEDQNIRSGTITALETQVRHNDRVNVSLDGAFAFGLNASIVLEQRLYVGQELSEDDVRALRQSEDVSTATQAAIRLVAHQARTESELRKRLARNGFPAPAIEAAIERMREWNYLDDQDFARRWVESREGHRPRSASMIKRELVGKGVDAETAEQVVDEAEIDEYKIALDLGLKWAARPVREDPEARRRRLAAYLQRRGFGWDIVRRVLDASLSDSTEEPE
jgi:regulatory protein